jgi:hypothetical protein
LGRDISGTTFFRAKIYQGRLFFRADRSVGAKQEGLTIVHFLNKLIFSCKEAYFVNRKKKYCSSGAFQVAPASY